MNKSVLIIGDSPGLESDLGYVLEGRENFDVMAVNRAIFRWREDVQYLVTYHGELVDGWLRRYGKTTPTVVTECGRYGVKFAPHPGTGGSALLALQYAQYLGYETVILAGIDLKGGYAKFFAPFVGVLKCMHQSGFEIVTVNYELFDALTD